MSNLTGTDAGTVERESLSYPTYTSNKLSIVNPVSRDRRKRDEYAAACAAAGRVAGGADAKAVLKAIGYRDDSDTEVPNRRALNLIAECIDGFRWWVSEEPVMKKHRGRIVSTGSTQKHVRYVGYPYVDGQNPSLADLVLWCLAPEGEKPFAFSTIQGDYGLKLQPLCAMGVIGTAFAQLLIDLECIIPQREMSVVIAEWLQKGVDGETLTMFSGVCPDYATDFDLHGRERYTFSELRDGIGVVASRAHGAFPKFAKFFAANGINVEFVAAIGDFEADSPETCAKVRRQYNEFIECLRRSQQRFAATIRGDYFVRLHTPLATEICGRETWDAIMHEAVEAAREDRFTGTMPMTQARLQEIAEIRSSLYSRWHGKARAPLDVLRGQAPEYMAMGSLAERAYPNCLVLGCDAPVMAPFFQGLGNKTRPVISLRNIDY